MALPEQTITIPDAPASPTALSGDALVQAATTPAVRPDFSDPFNARTAIAQRIGLTAAQTAENEIANKLRTFQTGAQKEQLAIQGNRDLSLGLAQGFQRQSAQTASLAERGILDELNLSRNQRLVLEQQAADEFNMFQQELGERRNLVAQALQFGDKGVDVNMSIDELTRRVAKSGQEYAEKQKKEAYKDDLKAQLRALGKSTSGSKNELEKRLKKVNKEALAEAKSRSDQEWAMKVAQFNKSMSGGSDKKNSVITQLLSKAANMTSGGEEFAKKNAALYGLTEADITPYLKGNWGDGYREEKSSKPVMPTKEIGDWIYYDDGSRENTVTGEIQVQG